MTDHKGNKTKVYIGDLGSGGSKPELEKEFERYGPLKSVWVARNPPGFAFIEFEDPRDAEESVKDMDGRRVCGMKIRVEIAKAENKSRDERFRDRRSPRRRSRSPKYGYSPERRRSRSPRRNRSRSPRRNYRREN